MGVTPPPPAGCWAEEQSWGGLWVPLALTQVLGVGAGGCVFPPPPGCNESARGSN